MYRYNESGDIVRETDGATIPRDPQNRDYRRLLESGADIAPFKALAPPVGEETPARLGFSRVVLDDQPYSITPADALKLSGAFLVALNSGETSVELESGETLVVTPANATAIAEQLAGG